jgi:outer membrane protein
MLASAMILASGLTYSPGPRDRSTTMPSSGLRIVRCSSRARARSTSSSAIFLFNCANSTRATVVQFWAQLNSAKAQIEATTVQINGAEIALNGVRGEARVGQRTTLDVLNAQQELVNARVALVTAQHDRVVASYALLAAVGGLSMQHLGLNVPIYDPMVHYQQVRDAWAGVRTPDGR